MRLPTLIFFILLQQIDAQSDSPPPIPLFVSDAIPNETVPVVVQPGPSIILPENSTTVPLVSIRENIEMIEITFQGVKPLMSLNEIATWANVTEQWMLQFYADEMLKAGQSQFNFRTFFVMENQTTRVVDKIPYTVIVYSQFLAYEAYPWSNTALFYARYPFTKFFANYEYGLQLRTSLKKWRDLTIPVLIPLMPGETYAPTLAPTPQPTVSPSQFPTSAPSVPPTDMPSDTPTIDISAAPSSIPSFIPSVDPTTSVEPTRSDGTPVSETLFGLQLSLRNAGKLVEIKEWETATSKWFSSFFLDSTNARRRLKEENVEDLSTQISFISSEVSFDDTNTSINTITYDQKLSYVARKGALSTDAYAILPFEDNTGNIEYGNVLRSFSNMERVELPLKSPAVPDQGGGGNGGATNGSNSYEDDGMSVGGIVGILFAALIVALVIAGSVGYNRRKRIQGEPFHGEDELSSDSELAKDQYDDIEQVMSEQPVVSKVQSYGVNSVATDEYDYDKAYVLRDRPQSTTSQASGSSLAYDFNKVEEESTLSPNAARAGKSGTTAVMAYEKYHRDKSASSSVTSHRVNSARVKQSNKLPIDDGSRDEVLTIVVPSGKLGLIIDTPNEGPPVIYAIKDSSIIGHKVLVDDRLIALDDIDVTQMTAIEVSKLISSRNVKPERKLTVLRKVKLDP